MNFFWHLKAKGLHIELRELIAATLCAMQGVLMPTTMRQGVDLRERLPDGSGNPSISADKRAAKSGLLVLNEGLSRIAAKVSSTVFQSENDQDQLLELKYIVEEGTDRTFVAKQLKPIYKAIPNLKKTHVRDIFASHICAVLDPCDGSMPFSLGQPNLLGIGLPPLYASGLSFIIDGISRYAGIWVPQPSPVDGTFIVVGLEGPDSHPERIIYSAMWRLGSYDVDFRKVVSNLKRPKKLSKSFIATHLSRTNPQGRAKVMNLLADESLAKISVFCLNSGLISLLATVFNGGVVVIPSTHIWDVASALPVLIAAKCSFSQWDGSPLDLTAYSPNRRLSIVAASSSEVHQEVLQLLQKYPLDRPAVCSVNSELDDMNSVSN